jgi:hypothetical protein
MKNGEWKMLREKPMQMVVYNIPVSLVPAYRGREVIVRTHDPSILVEALPGSELGNVVGVQLLSLLADVDALADWGYTIPVELVMRDPVTEFALLYRHAKLLDKHPVRASIPVVPGLSKAVSIATSLQYAVKLELGQPESTAIDEMLAVLDFYLHRASVYQPVEFFHTTLVSFFDRDPITLWDIQEENPAYVRYVTDEGKEIIARRMAGASEPGEFGSFVANLQDELLAENSECSRCEFFDYCGGYFKWPRRDYGCEGIKRVFLGLQDAAIELEHDLELFREARGEAAR